MMTQPYSQEGYVVAYAEAVKALEKALSLTPHSARIVLLDGSKVLDGLRRVQRMASEYAQRVG